MGHTLCASGAFPKESKLFSTGNRENRRMGELERRRGRDGQGIVDRKGSQNETAPTNYPTHNHSAINCSGPENTSERVRKGIGIGMGMGVGVGRRQCLQKHFICRGNGA